MAVRLQTKYNRYDLEDILPEDYLRKLIISNSSIDNLWMFTTTMQGFYSGVAIFVTYKGMEETARLFYIEVDEEYRKKGIGSELISSAAEHLKKLGIKEIEASIPERDSDSTKFFTESSFVKKDLYYVLDFELGEVKKTLNESWFDKMKPLMDKVSVLEDMNQAALENLKKRLGTKTSSDLKELLNSELCSCFMQGEEVKAQLIMNNYKDRVIYEVGLASDSSATSQSAVPPMLFSLLKRIWDEYPDSALIEIRVYSQKSKEALAQFLGQPKTVVSKTSFSRLI